MSSSSLGNTIFEITLCTWVFKYLVPKVVFFLTRIYWCFENSSFFSKISNFQIYSRQMTFLFLGLKAHFLNTRKCCNLKIILALTNFTSNGYSVPSGFRADLHNEARWAEFNTFWWLKNKCSIPFALNETLRYMIPNYVAQIVLC